MPAEEQVRSEPLARAARLRLLAAVLALGAGVAAVLVVVLLVKGVLG